MRPNADSANRKTMTPRTQASHAARLASTMGPFAAPVAVTVSALPNCSTQGEMNSQIARIRMSHSCPRFLPRHAAYPVGLRYHPYPPSRELDAWRRRLTTARRWFHGPPDARDRG